jgi:outer membrane murein-binding lipoprotein Lpp
MGKDGGLKARWDNLVGVSELWAKIDAMPTRRRALREAAAAAPQTTRLL